MVTRLSAVSLTLVLVLAAHSAAGAERKDYEARWKEAEKNVSFGRRGQVLAVLVRPETKASKCFADLTKRDTFSTPPAPRFWLPVTIKFTAN